MVHGVNDVTVLVDEFQDQLDDGFLGLAQGLAQVSIAFAGEFWQRLLHVLDEVTELFHRFRDVDHVIDAQLHGLEVGQKGRSIHVDVESSPDPLPAQHLLSASR